MSCHVTKDDYETVIHGVTVSYHRYRCILDDKDHVSIDVLVPGHKFRHEWHLEPVCPCQETLKACPSCGAGHPNRPCPMEDA